MGKFEDVLDIIPVEVVHTDDSTTTIVEDGDEDVDAQYARVRHYELSKAGSEALNIAMKIARETETPIAIKELSGLIKNLAEINKSLLSLHKDKADIKATRKTAPSIPKVLSGGTTVQQQNIIFTGNSKDLNKLINEQLANKG